MGGTDESPGSTITKNGKRYKFYSGMASLGAARRRKSKESTCCCNTDDDLNDYVAEGVEAYGSLQRLCHGHSFTDNWWNSFWFELLWWSYYINKCRLMLNLLKCHELDLQKVNHMMLMWYS